MRFLIALLALIPALAAAPSIEKRGGSNWPTANHFRFRHAVRTPASQPVWVDIDLPKDLNPDSVRVLATGTSAPVIASKIDWRMPNARVSWLSTGASAYEVYFDIAKNGETARLLSPAMVGAGDRVTFGRAGVRGKLAVGLWGFPAAVDMDGDGKIDLVVSCADHPFNGTYLFRNIGTNEKPLFDRALWLGRGKKELVGADFNGDGKTDLVQSGGYYDDVATNGLSKFVTVKLKRDYWIGRDDLWYPVDWDGDGKIDILAGVSDWREYGWDDAFDANGKWKRGPLHGYVYFHRNIGTNEKPEYAEPVQLQAAGKVIDRYGSPAPLALDWFGKGRLDLIVGEFVDTIGIFRNNGKGLDALVPLTAAGKPIKLDLCMIQPRISRFHADGRPSLMVAEEDGTIVYFENTAAKGQEPKLAEARNFEQVDPFVKSGALSRPVPVDWNNDGKLDLIVGNSAGYIQYFENVGTRTEPAWADRGYLKAGDKVIRRIAGPNGSIQGPAEFKWGYSNPWVADWDMDGKLDLIVNDILGEVIWYRNIGTREKPELAPAQPIEVEWQGRAPKPDWVWWEPKGKALLTQWRTTPRVIDWNADGLPDLVMLNHQGYLCFYRRYRENGVLKLAAPEKIFIEPGGRFLNLASGRAGASGRRKVDFADWNGDGKLDLITDSGDGPIWYENVGTRERPVMRNRGLILNHKISGHNPTPVAADFNGDGKLDLLVGAEDGMLYFFDRNYIDAPAPKR